MDWWVPRPRWTSRLARRPGKTMPLRPRSPRSMHHEEQSQKIAAVFWKESKKFDEVYSASSAMDGFRVAGMKAGALVLQSENLKPRGSLKTDEFAAWLLPAFFASPPGFGPLPPDPSAAPVPPESVEIDVRTARAMLEQLQAISVAAEAGFGGTLRAASLLFTREMRLGGRCEVRLIDLAHFAPSSERDANFCDGLANLVRVWEAWCRSQEPWCMCCGQRK
ncbi:unnamed protein product [Durusdinium trenchii]|uniref:Kinase n=1 Tax=Durusdinium trenchii TaxID=1381693 RepID=A0ABP0PIG2_9DINO